MNKRKIIKLFSAIALLSILMLPIFVFAQTQFNISSGIPGTNANTTSSSPGAFIANFYQFALIIAGVLAFGVIVYGGIRYMTSAGNPSGQSDAKEWIEAALLGLLLLAGAYFILGVVNPQLLNLNLPGLTTANVNLSSVQVPGGGGLTISPGGVSSGGTCNAPAAGPCTVANLQNTCMGSNAAAAAQICNAESSGKANLGGDLSTTGQPVSIGLFQINLTANTLPGLNCPAAFDHTWHAPGVCGKGGNTGCGPSTIKNDPQSQALYAQCVAAAENINTNITKACSMSNQGAKWSQWSTSKTCNL